MAPTTKTVEEASAQELRDFAEISLGLEVNGTENKNVMMARIREAGFTVENIVVYGKPEPVSKGAPDGAREFREEEGRWYQAVTIHTDSGEGGDRPLPIRVNGKTMLVPRGERVWIPEEYVGALKDARETVWNMTASGLSDPRDVPSYPYAIG